MKIFDAVMVGILILIAVIIMTGYIEFEMSEIVASGILTKLYSACIALVLVRVSLAIFDRTSGANFGKWLADASNGDKALYYAGRYIGTCLLFGMIIG